VEKIHANNGRLYYRVEKNGRTGRIKPWGRGVFGTTFRHAGTTRRSSFATFEGACEYLDREFSALDRNVADSTTLYPVRHDVRTYHELEQLLRENGNGATLREAVDFYIARNRKAPFNALTVSQCCQKFLIDHRASPPHMKTLRKHLGHFEKSFGYRKIDEIEPQAITEWLRSHPTPKGGLWSPKTQSSVKGSLVTMALYSRDTLHAISATGKTAFQIAKTDRKRKRPPVEIYTPNELRLLLNNALHHDIELIPALVVGCFEGLRPDEFHAENARDVDRRPLSWNAFNWTDQIVHVGDQKNRSAHDRDVPFHKSAQAWLAPFRNETGEIWQLKKAFDRRMKRVCDLAGVPRYFDGFRHSYASYRIRHLKHDYDSLAAEMGNSRNEILRSYRRLVTDAQADEWFSVMPPKGYSEKVALVLKNQAPRL
jgi:integrase